MIPKKQAHVTWKFFYFVADPDNFLQSIKPGTGWELVSVSTLPYVTIPDTHDAIEIQRYLAKFVKLNPHIVFEELVRGNTVTIWLDSCFELEPDQFYKVFEQKLKRLDDAVLFLPHGKSKTEEEEATRAQENKKPGIMRIKEQLEYYKRHRSQKDIQFVGQQFYNGGLIISKPDRNKVFFNVWWDHNCIFSSRDEISLRYVAAKTLTKLEILLHKCYVDLNLKTDGIRYGGTH